MSTKHTATLPDGRIVTRTSANRVYPFCVAVSPMLKAERLAELERDLKAAAEYAASYTETSEYVQDGGELATVSSGHGHTTYAVGLEPRGGRSYYETQRGQRCVGHGETREVIAARYAEYAINQLARIERITLELIEVEAGPDVVGTWSLSGWQSRADLAAKEAIKQRGYWSAREVVIIETEYATS